MTTLTYIFLPPLLAAIEMAFAPHDFAVFMCAGKRQEHVELLEMERDGVHVASYLTKLIAKQRLEQKLHEAVRLARAQFETQRD